MVPANISKHRKSLRILFIGDIYYGYYSSHYEKHFRKMGHKVVTLCPTGNIRVQGGFDYEKNILPCLKELDFQPDLVVAAESPPVYWANYQKIREATKVPIAFLSFDTALRHRDHAVFGNKFDYVFISQQDYLPYFQKHCAAPAFWLQYGCDPEIHTPLPGREINDIAFAGSAWCCPKLYQIRIDYLTSLKKEFRLEIGEGFWGKQAVELYARSKIIFNLALQNGVNPRIYEALSYGKLLLTNRTNALNRVFNDGVDLVYYDGLHHLKFLIRYYIKNPEIRQKIASQGHDKVWLKHTFYHRVDLILRQIFGHAIY